MIRTGRGYGRVVAALGMAWSLCAAAPAAADWLVTKGGTLIETRGAWELKDGRVVFTNPDGRLITLPLAFIDLEASKSATTAAAAPTPTPALTGRTPLAVVTDADVSHVVPGHEAPSVEVDGAAGVPRVTLYSARWCGWCRKTRALLDELGVEYAERDVDRDAAARERLLQLTGGSFGVPVLEIGEDVVRGYVPDRIRALVTAPKPTVPVSDPAGG